MTQCEIGPGRSLTYNYTLQQHGTFWLHAHSTGQYPDGLRTALVIRAANEPQVYAAEHTLTLSDWYHTPIKNLIPAFISHTNPTGIEPVPDAALANDSQNVTFSVQPDTTYRLRLVNVAAFATFHFWIEGHEMELIEVDGVDTEPMKVSGLTLTASQRASVLIRTKSDASQNFAMVASMDTEMFDKTPPGLNTNVTSYLQYSSTAPLPLPARVAEYPDSDDIDLVPLVQEAVVEQDQTLVQNVAFEILGNGRNYGLFNGISYMPPQVPTLLTALTTGENATDPAVYGTQTNPTVLSPGETVQIVVNNEDKGTHPFHLHGHVFQVLYRSSEPYEPTNTTWLSSVPQNPMRRDTVSVPGKGHVILRFKADNPGIWLFHCHVEWHIISGLTSTFIESPLELQKTQSVPGPVLEMCREQGVSVRGNAMGREGASVRDLKGERTQPDALPAGITARGWIALVGTALCAVLGMATIAWYGASQLRDEDTNEKQSVDVASSH